MSHITRPQGLAGDIDISKLTDDEHDETILKLLFHIRQQNIRANRQLFDHSRPVEEWFSTSDPQPAGEYELQMNYHMPVRITGFFASFPPGTVNATLHLGRERDIPLISGVGGITATARTSGSDLGWMLTENDRRTIELTGTMTAGFYIGLFGWAFEWAGNA